MTCSDQWKDIKGMVNKAEWDWWEAKLNDHIEKLPDKNSDERLMFCFCQFLMDIVKPRQG